MTIDDPVLQLVVKHIDGIKDHVSAETSQLREVVKLQVAHVEEKVDRLDREGCSRFAAHRDMLDAGPAGDQDGAPRRRGGFRSWHPAAKTATLGGGGLAALYGTIELLNKVMAWLSTAPAPGK